ncbi:hypothetical protein SNEBB_003418 [Seison nebaliae]|nr:hypothetical protein SNEBB_003418 [Seison nebaliae]
MGISDTTTNSYEIILHSFPHQSTSSANQTVNEKVDSFRSGQVYISVTASYVYIICAVMFTIVGTLGNGLSLAVFTQKHMRKYSTNIYLAVLTLVDTLYIYIGTWRYFIFSFFDYDIRTTSINACRIHKFLQYVCSSYSVWILVFVSLDRLLLIKFPTKAKMWSCKRTIMSICIISFIIVCIFQSPNLFLYGYEVQTNLTNFSENIEYDNEGLFIHNSTFVNCVALPKYEEFDKKVLHYLVITLFCFLPFTIILYCNINITHFVLRSRKLSQNHGTMQRDRNMNIMLVSVTFTFICLLTPLYLDNIFGWRTHFNRDTASLLFSLEINLMFMNHAINFFLYCLTGIRFRNALCTLFPCASGDSKENITRKFSSNITMYRSCSRNFQPSSSIKFRSFSFKINNRSLPSKLLETNIDDHDTKLQQIYQLESLHDHINRKRRQTFIFQKQRLSLFEDDSPKDKNEKSMNQLKIAERILHKQPNSSPKFNQMTGPQFIACLFALLFPPLGVLMYTGAIDGRVIVALILTLIFWIPGVIYAWMVILDYL